MNDFQVALVTGGSRGIGAAVVERLARHVGLVFLNYRCSQAAAEGVRDRVAQSGGRVELLRADISERDAVCEMFERVAGKAGRLDILVHCATPPLEPRRLVNLDWEADVVPQLAVACAGFLYCIQAAKPLLVAGSRVVVLLTDALFHTPPVQIGGYLAAKGALWGLVRAAAKELQPRGISFNTVSPAMTKTDLLHSYGERVLEILAQDHPLGRLATPEEIASLVEALVTQSPYLHGANIIANGGANF